MAKAVRYHKQGGPEVLQVDEVPVGDPGPGQARVRHKAIGVNFVDTYQRSGLYPMQLPGTAGNEGAGVVEAVGQGVTSVKAGDRVTYTGLPGSYCEVRVVPADRLVKLPDGVTEEMAASMTLKGMTVQYLIHRTYAVKSGDTVLWHAAAGGVGLIAGQWLKALGVKQHRHRRLRGEGRARQGARLAERDQLQQGKLRREGEVAHRRQGRAGGVRRGRQDDLGRLARMPAPARPDGVVRQRLRPGGAGEPRHPGAEGLALRHAAHARDLHRLAPRSGGDREDRCSTW